MVFGFLTNIKNGFLAANEVRRVVLSDPQLFIYPILAVIICAFAFLALGAMSYLVLLTTQSLLATLIALFILYVVIVFISVYFLVAMLIAFREFANKKKIAMGDALSRANQYIGLIFEWVVFISVIKVILDIIEIAISSVLSRYGFIGNIIARLITGVASFALAVASLFAIPIIIDEKTGPVQTIKSSTKFIIHNWGETFGGFVYTEIVQIALCAVAALFFMLAFLELFSAINGVGIGALFSGAGMLIALGIFLVIFVVLMLFTMSTVGAALIFIIIASIGLGNPSGGSDLAILLAGIGIFLAMLGHLLNYMLFNCFKLIVYDYKTRNKVPADFDKSVIDRVVKTNPKAKSSNKGFGGMLGLDS